MDGKPDIDQQSDFKNDSEALRVFKVAVEHAPMAVSMTRKNGSHIYHNLQFKALFGYDRDELGAGLFRRLFVHSEDLRQIASSLEKSNAWSGEVEMKTRSGRVIPVSLEAKAVTDSPGEPVFLGIYTDITERKATKKEIQYQQEYLSTLHSISLGMFRRLNLSDLLNAVIVRASKITGIPNGFLHLYDPEQNCLVMEAACGHLTSSVGYRVDPGTGLGGVIFKTGEPMIIENYQEWDKKLVLSAFEQIYSVVGIPLVSGSRIEGVIGLSHHEPDQTIDPEIIAILEEFAAIAQIAIDNAKLFEKQKKEFERRITLEQERKEMEAKLYQSQRMESIGTLAGGIAHDFNNILSSIMGFTQIAMGETDADSRLAEDLTEIYNASLRARDLTRQILTFARQTDEEVNPLRLSLIAKEVLKFIRSSIPTTIDIQHNIVSRAKVLADPTQVYQIFLNLLTNAAQAMEASGGSLSVDVLDDHLETPYESVAPGEYVKIRISDTGTGISSEHLPTIFDPYFTTKEIGEGTGLGLSVVHGAVKRMGGEIFVTSELGTGTEFVIYLPAADQKLPLAEESGKTADLPRGKGEHILVVDDEVTITKVLKRMLENHGYSVTAFNDSSQALDAFKDKPDAVSALVTDMTMPKMTGHELINAMRSIRPDLPVVLCTGFSHHLTKDALKKSGIHYYCNKPILKEDLIQTVHEALGSRTGA